MDCTDLEVGDHVMVSNYSLRSSTEAEVARVGRTWLDLVVAPSGRTMSPVRRADGRSKDGHTTVRSMEDYRAAQDRAQAESTLREAGLQVIVSVSPPTTELLAELAAVVVRHRGV